MINILKKKLNLKDKFLNDSFLKYRKDESFNIFLLKKNIEDKSQKDVYKKSIFYPSSSKE